MALLHEFEVSMRLGKKFNWQDPVEDFFESLINTDLLQSTSAHDTCRILDPPPEIHSPSMDSQGIEGVEPWASALRLVAEDNAASCHNLAADSTTSDVFSEVDLSLAPSPQIPHEPPASHFSPKSPSLNRYSSYNSYSPLRSRTKQSASKLPSAAKVKKSPRKASHSPNMSNWAISSRGTTDILSRQLGATTLEQLSPEIHAGETLISSFHSTPVKSQIYDHYGYVDAAKIQSNYEADYKESLSPEYPQHPATPLSSPVLEDASTSQSSSDEADFAGYAPLHMIQQGNIQLCFTPPLSQPLQNCPWINERKSSLGESESDEKDDLWWEGGNAEAKPPNVESTCGASVSNTTGLGIIGTSSIMSSNMARTADQWIPTTTDVRLCSCPTPCSGEAMTFLEGAALSNPTFSASASPPNTSFGVSPVNLQKPGSMPGSSSMVYDYRNRDRTPTAPVSPNPSVVKMEVPTPQKPRTPPSSPTKHKRSKSGGRHRHRTSANGTPRSPKNGMGFVNFTPQDKNKILTGVAPSGSSKTKARREKEALEKRRQLSEAAKRAVLEAGGDLEALEREGLLVMESGI